MLSSKVISEILWLGASLEVQWLTFLTPNAGSPGSIPGLGTRSHMLQLRVLMLHLKFQMQQQKLKISCAPTKTWCSPINVKKKKEKTAVYHIHCLCTPHSYLQEKPRSSFCVGIFNFWYHWCGQISCTPDWSVLVSFGLDLLHIYVFLS